MGKTKRPLHDRKTEHFKALSKNCQTSAIADHITSTGHHFEILATERSDIHCRIKESLLIKGLKRSLNENVGSETIVNNYGETELFFTSLLYIFRRALIGLFIISFSPLS